ncbi:tRNA wybutosine-synthesizing protein 2/3/4-like isoform X1 [Alosa alosa]|nr:tRNA wybutosine-synthesizing protein 2/3/4-like isoform X1 [Alosa alosa]
MIRRIMRLLSQKRKRQEEAGCPSMTQRSSLSLWSPLPQGPPAPCTRYRHACSSHKGDVYLLGGRERMVLRDFWKYSVVRNDWTKLDCSSEWAPEELEGHTMVSHQGILYVFGGLIDSAYTDWKMPLWLFDIEKEEWRYSEGQIQPSQPAPVNRKGHSAVVFGSAMYIYGGYIDIRGPSQEFWKYEFDTGVWSLLSGVQAEQGPGPRHGHRGGGSSAQHVPVRGPEWPPRAEGPVEVVPDQPHLELHQNTFRTL